MQVAVVMVVSRRGSGSGKRCLKDMVAARSIVVAERAQPSLTSLRASGRIRCGALVISSRGGSSTSHANAYSRFVDQHAVQRHRPIWLLVLTPCSLMPRATPTHPYSRLSSGRFDVPTRPAIIIEQVLRSGWSVQTKTPNGWWCCSNRSRGGTRSVSHSKSRWCATSSAPVSPILMSLLNLPISLAPSSTHAMSGSERPSVCNTTNKLKACGQCSQESSSTPRSPFWVSFRSRVYGKYTTTAFQDACGLLVYAAALYRVNIECAGKYAGIPKSGIMGFLMRSILQADLQVRPSSLNPSTTVRLTITCTPARLSRTQWVPKGTRELDQV